MANRLLDSNEQLRDAEAHQRFAGSCFSSALARANSVAGFEWRLLRRLILSLLDKLSAGRDWVNDGCG